MSNSNFQWRPNDNGALTNLRYNLEASKWVQAVRSAKLRHKPMTFKSFIGDVNFVGNLIQLPLLLIFMIFLIPFRLIREIFGYNIRIFPGDEPTGKVRRGTYESVDEFKARLDAIHKECEGMGRKRKKKWKDLTDEEQTIVMMVRQEIAKARAEAKK